MKSKNTRRPSRMPIAIVGIGCRYPGGINSAQELWQKLLAGVDGIVDIPPDRWDAEALYDPDTNVRGKINTRRGGFIKGIDQFDPGFFNIAPIEANHIDPQQRLLLEVAFHALEDAGLTLEQVSGSRCGVFVGVCSSDYQIIQHHLSARANIGPHSNTGLALSLTSNRLSYVFNLLGPSLTIDTACSSSLTSVHLAALSIERGECDMALAGGVNVILTPEFHIAQSKANMLSPDGYCKSFDASADGYVRSEGAGMVLVKPLHQALKDGDDIYAIIKGSAVNQDGRTQGISLPSLDAQVDLLKNAYQSAGVNPKDVDYIEAHGTGTPVGDPIEASAIGFVVGKNRNRPCLLGSLKSNIGHLESAAGIAGLAKAALSLKHGKVPANLHFHTPNPVIPFRKLKLRVPTQTTPLQKSKKNFVGVNSFGFGGSNAHVVLEAAPQSPHDSTSTRSAPYLFALSARHPFSLKSLVQKNIEFLSSTNTSLADICNFAARKRTPFEYRVALVANNKEELKSSLLNWREANALRSFNNPKVAFVFSGQGAQWYAMGRQLMATQPFFKKSLEKIDRAFQAISGLSILHELKKDKSKTQIDRTEIAQPAILALQIALTELYAHYGIVAQGYVGHSVGEVAAAYASGALSLDEALKVIFHRSRLQAKASGKGKMLAIAVNHIHAKKLVVGLERKVSIAAMNGPELMTLSGDAEALENIATQLQSQGIFHQYLAINVPFHSHHMDPLQGEMLKALSKVKSRETHTALYSTVSARRENGKHLNAPYWFSNMRKPVDLVGAITSMIEDGFDAFLEIGPHPIHGAGIHDLLSKKQKVCLVSASLSRRHNEQESFLKSLGTLWTWGLEPNWNRLFDQRAKHVKMPPYTWNKERYWLETKTSQEERFGSPKHPLLYAERRTLMEPSIASWSVSLDKRVNPYLAEHQLHDLLVFPGAGILDLALSAASLSLGPNHRILSDVEFKNALVIPNEGEATPIQLDISLKDGQFFVYAQDFGMSTWVEIASGQIGSLEAKSSPNTLSLKEIRDTCTLPLEPDLLHDIHLKGGLKLGENLKRAKNVFAQAGEALVEVDITEGKLRDLTKYCVHPAILDSCLRAIQAIWPNDNQTKKRGVFIPRRMGSMVLNQNIAPSRENNSVFCHVKSIGESKDHREVNLVIFDGQGNCLAKIHNYVFQYLEFSREVERVHRASSYRPSWRKEIGIEQSTRKPFTVDQQLPSTWVIFADEQGLAARFQALFDEEGMQTHVVSPKHFGNMQKIVDDLAVQLRSPFGVVYLPGVDMPDTSQLRSEDFQKTLASHTLPFIGFIQALKSQSLPDPIKTLFVTQNAQAVEKDDKLNLLQSAFLGMGRVFINEHPASKTLLIDLDDDIGPETIKALFNEIFSVKHHLEVAYRNKMRCLLSFTLQPKTSVGVEAKSLFHSDASYLITGGKSGLGLEIAQWMAEQGAGQLVLASRNALATPEEARRIEHLRSLGATIILENADMAKMEDVESVLSRIHQSGRPLKGIIHAAGVYKDEALAQISEETLTQVLAPKILGAWNLHLATLNQPLNFFLPLSSVTSVYGNPGQASYAIANAFLDGLSHQRRALGLASTTLNLGPVDQVGYLATHSEIALLLEKQGMHPLKLTEVMTALNEILSDNVVQQIHCKIDWVKFGNYFPVSRNDERFSQLIWLEGKKNPALKTVATHGLVYLLKKANNSTEQLHIVGSHLKTVIAGILGHAPETLDTRKPFNQIGFDSLMATQLRIWILNSLNVDVPMVQVLRSRGLDELTDHVLKAIQKSPAHV